MALAHSLRIGLSEGRNIYSADAFACVQSPRGARCGIKPCRASHDGRIAVLGRGCVPIGAIGLREEPDALNRARSYGIPAYDSRPVLPCHVHPRSRQVVGHEDRGVAGQPGRGRSASGQQDNRGEENEGFHNGPGKSDTHNIDDLFLSREQSNAVALCF